MDARIDDKKLLKNEIKRLELALMTVSDSLVLACSSSNNHGAVYKKVEEALMVELNSAKLEFEVNWGLGNWLLQPDGFRVI